MSEMESDAAHPVEILDGIVVVIEPVVELVIIRANDGRVFAAGSEVFAMPLSDVERGMCLRCVVTTRPACVVSAHPLGTDAQTVADIIRTLPAPLSDIDTAAVLAPSAKPGDVVVPPLPKEEPSG